MKKLLIFLPLILLILGCSTLFILPIIEKQIYHTNKFQTSLTSTNSQIEHSAKPLLKELSSQNFFDSLIKNLNNILGTLTTLVGLVLSSRQLFNHHKKKKASKPKSEEKKNS